MDNAPEPEPLVRHRAAPALPERTQPGAAAAAGDAPSDDVQAIASEIGRLLGATQAKMVDCWRGNAVSMDTLHVLVTLRTHGSMSMSQLAHSRGVSLPNATCIVDRMEERGLVERVRDGHDRRIVTVHLAPGGEQLLAKTEQVRRALLVRVLDAMTPGDRAAYSQAVRAFYLTYRRLAEAGKLDDLSTSAEAELS